jgi:hypothetical protein
MDVPLPPAADAMSIPKKEPKPQSVKRAHRRGGEVAKEAKAIANAVAAQATSVAQVAAHDMDNKQAATQAALLMLNQQAVADALATHLGGFWSTASQSSGCAIGRQLRSMSPPAYGYLPGNIPLLLTP